MSFPFPGLGSASGLRFGAPVEMLVLLKDRLKHAVVIESPGLGMSLPLGAP